MSARTYACPSCGAQVDEHARRCRYCQAPVATVRCASCFHMSVPDAGFCSGCGLELGLEPLGQRGDLTCPLCHEALEAYREGPGSLFDCGLCGGQFVEHLLLQELIGRRERPSIGQDHARPSLRPDARTGYIPCPACSALMNRKQFGGHSGVIVDVCKKHGTWFDLGKLPRALAFVASGGFAESQRRAAEEAARVRHEAALAAHDASVDVRVSAGASSFASSVLASLLR